MSSSLCSTIIFFNFHVHCTSYLFGGIHCTVHTVYMVYVVIINYNNTLQVTIFTYKLSSSPCMYIFFKNRETVLLRRSNAQCTGRLACTKRRVWARWVTTVTVSCHNLLTKWIESVTGLFASLLPAVELRQVKLFCSLCFYVFF